MRNNKQSNIFKFVLARWARNKVIWAITACGMLFAAIT